MKFRHLKKGFSLVETIVSLLLISIVFAVVSSGLSSILQSLSIISNQQRVVELENFIARYVYMQGTLGNVQIDKNMINQAFYQGSQVSYPNITNIQSNNVGQYFVKYSFTIESIPGKPHIFYVYLYKTY
ncbi:type II secretion system protein [Fervidobacterium sp.]